VEVFAELLTVGRGLPGGKFLSLSRQRKEPKKGDPDSPEFPKIKRVGWAAKNSPRLVVFDFVFCGRSSNTFAADPPTTLDLRRACKGRQIKTSLPVSGRREPGWGFAVKLTQVYKPPHYHWPGFDFMPLSVPPEIGPAGRISGKGV